MHEGFIGVFDVGVGGLSVLRALQQALPMEAFWYVADQAHFPYGREQDEKAILHWSDGIARFLVERGAKLIVVACHAATAAALQRLRMRYPQVPFVGVEPALKPAVMATRSGVIGVLATEATLRSQRYVHLVRRYASYVKILSDPCPGLVERIEAGDLDGPGVRRILRRAVEPMLEQGADTFVLGCTHYSFVEPTLRALVGPEAILLDSAPEVARRVQEVLFETGRARLLPRFPQGTRYFTTGDPRRFAQQVVRLLGEDQSVSVHRLVWQEGRFLARVRPREIPMAVTPSSAWQAMAVPA
ncbi:MAG: glutamate racemase [Chloroflexi bacterium]|nr:glutamate racemase [Chloroflexota bacterium]